MSYCVECGVKLADYNKECPLCGTAVINPNKKVKVRNDHYPNYEVVEPNEKKIVNRYVTGLILTIQVLVYSTILLGLNLLIEKKVSWSVIPILSLGLVWITVAYPFFRKRNSFFRLFTYDCITVSVYLLSLNYVISRNFIWSKFACVGILFLWVIIAGIFLTERIRKAFPVTIFYLLSAVILSFVLLSFFKNSGNIMRIGIPIIVVFLVLGVISYILIKSTKHANTGLITILLANITIMCLAIDFITHYYLYDKFTLSWSVIILIMAVPAIVTLFSLKRVTELRAYISRKMHN